MANIHEWFKVIQDGELIGTVTNLSFAKYIPETGRLLICDAIDGQYLVLNDRFYRDSWMLPVNKDADVEFETATILSIPEKEYVLLSTPEEEHEPIVVDNTPEKEDISAKAPTEADTATIEYVRKKKLEELSATCEEVIKDGFSLVLADGASHHFSMSIEDQINLINLELALDRHEDTIYHADGELSQYYSEEDARSIVNGAHKWSMYNRALFNSFKNWINNIEDIYEIGSITFDSEIPDEYCTDALQTLIQNI